MKLPEMVYKPRFAVTRASHVVFRVRDCKPAFSCCVSEAGFQSPTNALVRPLRSCVLSLGATVKRREFYTLLGGAAAGMLGASVTLVSSYQAQA